MRFGRKTEKGFKRHAFHPHRIPEVFARDTPPDVEKLRPSPACSSSNGSIAIATAYSPTAVPGANGAAQPAS